MCRKGSVFQFLLLLYALQNFSCYFCYAKKQIKTLSHGGVKSQSFGKTRKKTFLGKLLFSVIYFLLGFRNPCDICHHLEKTDVRMAGFSGYSKHGNISLRLRVPLLFCPMNRRKWKVISLERWAIWYKGDIRRDGGSCYGWWWWPALSLLCSFSQIEWARIMALKDSGSLETGAASCLSFT